MNHETGIGAFFEANVVWELRQGDQVVESGFTTAEQCCTMAPYSFPLPDVPADCVSQYLLEVGAVTVVAPQHPLAQARGVVLRETAGQAESVAASAEELARAFEEAIRSGKALSVGMADAPAWAIARVENHSHREVLEMTYLDGLAADEIGDRHGAKPGEYAVISVTDSMCVPVVT